ncbi:hypothetical protein Tco_0092559, partial [Tanacetum coccineum]
MPPTSSLPSFMVCGVSGCLVTLVFVGLGWNLISPNVYGIVELQPLMERSEPHLLLITYADVDKNRTIDYIEFITPTMRTRRLEEVVEVAFKDIEGGVDAVYVNGALTEIQQRNLE